MKSTTTFCATLLALGFSAAGAWAQSAGPTSKTGA
jgi:hypothetical protein